MATLRRGREIAGLKVGVRCSTGHLRMVTHSSSVAFGTLAGMERQLIFEQSVIVDRPIADVFEYVSDVNRAHEWRSEVVESTMWPAGPMRHGMVTYEVTYIRGRRIVTETVIDTMSAPERFSFSHLNGPLPTSGECVFVAGPEGTEMTYRLVIELRGGWVLFGRYLRRLVEQNMTRSLATLRSTLESRDQKIYEFV